MQNSISLKLRIAKSLRQARLLKMHDVLAGAGRCSDRDHPTQGRRALQHHLLRDHATERIAQKDARPYPETVEEHRERAAIQAVVVGTEPRDRPTPAFSNMMSSRPLASGSVTAGSQLSIVPVKCCKHSSGRPGPA